MTTKEIQDRAEAAKHAPITLPAGSYTLEDIEKIHAAAVKAKPDQRQKAVDEALEAANQTFTERPDQGLEPGMKYVDVEREDLGITERVQVRAKPAGETEEETAEIDQKVIDKQIADASAGASQGKPGDSAAAGKE